LPEQRRRRFWFLAYSFFQQAARERSMQRILRDSGSVTIVVLMLASLVHGQAVVDGETLVLNSFDATLQPDHARGTNSITLRGGELVKQGGRFGGGLFLPSGGGLELSGNDGNLTADQGTIEFWIKPAWAGNAPEKHSLFSARVGDQEYLNINTLGSGRLGIAMAAGTGDDFRWRRANGDSSSWEPNTWHHVTFAWGDGKLSVFLDGKEDTDDVDDSLMLRGLPGKLILIGADAVIDDFQIHSRRFDADAVAKAIELALSSPVRMIDTLEYQTNGEIQRGGMTILGDVVLPMVLGNRSYSRGFAFGSDATLEFLHDESAKRLRAKVGVSAFATADTACRFEVWGDGERLYGSKVCHRDAPPESVSVDLSGKKRIRLTAVGDGFRNREALWAIPRLEDPDASVPAPTSGKLSDERLDMYRRQLAADDYECDLGSDQPWIVCAKHWADDVDVTRSPETLDADAMLTAAAAPGEYEPLNFMIFAQQDMEDVAVSVSDLKSDDAVVVGDACDVRLVLRRLMRDVYTLPPERSTVVSRFLLRNQPVDIPAGTFREYHVIVHVPMAQTPGDYHGTLTIKPDSSPSKTLPLNVTVRPIQLGAPTPNAYGMYYRFPSEESDWAGLDRELVDIREHGGRMLKSNLSVGYHLTDGTIAVDVGRLRRGLQLLAKRDYEGPMPVGSGAAVLARLLRYDPVADYQNKRARTTFYAAIADGMRQLERLKAEFPQFELMPTHMDEVFGHDRLPRYNRLTEAVREATDMRVYITLHNDPKRKVEPLIRQLDPFVDVRSFNGHCMDNWIRAGNTFEDLERELAASGDEAWLYHNIRGSFFPAEWTRLVNGFYMWLSPLRIHVPWMYYSYKMNPMDSTDGPELRGGDFAYAVPDPDNADAMIPTRHWEAYREGVDDMRYLRTLERLIDQNADRPEARRAQRWLTELRERLTPTHEELEAIEIESPLLVFLAKEFDGAGYRRFRREAAGHIMELQRN
jgi:hypothetical protein